MNVWYKTDKTPEDYVDESGANATLSDGHENPWLSDEATAPTLGEDGRAVDFTGWKLWRADVPTTEATELSVADLGLEDDEHVTAVRFEYGRVEAGFTTRDGGWDRDGIKDAHDDIASAEDTAKENGFHPDSSGDGPETAYAPAIFHMKATDGYTAGRALDNYARVDLFRNGGGDGLEGHDEDQGDPDGEGRHGQPRSDRPATSSSASRPRLPSPPPQPQPSSTAAAPVRPPRTTKSRTTMVMTAKTTAMKTVTVTVTTAPTMGTMTDTATRSATATDDRAD